MQLSRQDSQIILSLLDSDAPITRNHLSRETGIDKKQVTNRLDKLQNGGVVYRFRDKNAWRYTLHPVLKSRVAVEEITNHLRDISTIIDGMHMTTPEGLKTLITFIIEHTDVVKANGD